MADERVSNEDMERTYQKGYEDGVQAERPRAFGAGYKAGFDNGRKSVEDNDYCNNCPHLNFELVHCKDCEFFYQSPGASFKECELDELPAKEHDFCSWAKRRK